MKRILKENTNWTEMTLSRKEMQYIKGGGDECYSELDNEFAYCIETDGVLYGVFTDSDGGICVDLAIYAQSLS